MIMKRISSLLTAGRSSGAQKNDRPQAIRELREALRLHPESDEKEKIQQLLHSLS